MPRITRSALVMFSAEQMFRLVNDVDAYPEFLPGCVGSRVHESGEDYMMASVDVAKAGIASESLPLDKIAQRIMVEIGR